MKKMFLEDEIIKWADDRGLILPENAFKQTCKLLEESGELAGAVLKNNRPEIKDALGDVYVVLVILSKQLGLCLNCAVKSAYNEIKDRKGKTIGGTFVKEDVMNEHSVDIEEEDCCS